MISLYRPGTSAVHRLPAGVKVGVLLAGSLFLSLWPHDPVSVGVSLAVVVALYVVAGLSLRVAAAEIWRLRGVIVALGVLLALFVSVEAAWVGTGRVVAILLLATLVTTTTTASALLDVLRAALRPLRRARVDPEAVAMTMLLALTMVPVIADFSRQVREAGHARGARVGVRGAVPLLVMTLRHADEVGEALSARGLA